MPRPLRRRGRVAVAVVAALLVGTVLAACGRTTVLRVASQACVDAPVPSSGSRYTELPAADGTPRGYVIRIPKTYDHVRPTPVILLFHGLGSTPQLVLKATRMDQLADRRNVIIVAINGTTQAAGRRGWALSSPGFESDAAYVERVVADVESRACVDTARIFAAGFSNGSAFSMKLGCHDIAGIAAVGAVSAPYVGADCEGMRPKPLVYFHGTGDRVVPYDGGATPIGELPSVVSAMAEWGRLNGCAAPFGPTRSSRSVDLTTWRYCLDDVSIDAYTVERGGHRWPGGRRASAAVGLAEGQRTREVDATATMWAFFVSHPRHVAAQTTQEDVASRR